MTPTVVANKLLEIEARVADLDWIRNGVNVWPMYRCLLLLRLFEELVATPSVRTPKVSLSNLWGGALPETGDLTSCTVLLNDGFSLQRLGDQTIDRFCTPLSMGLDRIGVPNVVLDQGFSSTAGLAKRAGVIGPTILRAKVRGLLRARLTPDPWVSHRHERLCQAATTTGLGSAVIPTARDLFARQAAMFDLAGAFERLLVRLKADRVFQVSYYSVAGYAMNLAARRLGLPVIDVQHGVITPLHLAYANWSLPEGEDHLLPTAHWTWGAAEAAVVLAGRRPGDCTAVAGGHPLVGAWREGWLPGVEDARAEALQLRDSHSAMRHALVTLQPGLMSRADLEPLLAVLTKRRDVFWWFRLHPASKSDLPELASLIDETGASYDIETATRLPLLSVLESVDVNLTHSSTTVLEAAAFGVPSILWSPYGQELFDDIIGTGDAYPAVDEAAIMRLLISLPDRVRRGGSPASQFTTALGTFTR